MQLSKFGQKLSVEAGIVTLMDDLGEALRVNPNTIFMGGGNPAAIPAVEAELERALQSALDDPAVRLPMLGVYQPPQGDPQLLDSLAERLRREYRWPISRANLALSNGSQSAFFVLFNLLGGEGADGVWRKIQLPLVPEYLGYADQGLTDGLFRATRPAIELLPEGLFKYHIDFDRLELGADTGALCLSRPTNPTGNVVSGPELERLDALARAQSVPLIIDGAYGAPFPNIHFDTAAPFWNDNTILVLSLSKLGLPGVRTGIVLAHPEVIQAFTRANTVLSLANGNLGPVLAQQLLNRGRLLSLGPELIQPFYRERMQAALAVFQRELVGLPCRIHLPQGAFFLWLWFEGLPGGSEALYQRLKQRGVLAVPGQHFFPGLEEEWPHRDECLRVTYCQDPQRVARGAAIVGEEVRRLYAQAHVGS